MPAGRPTKMTPETIKKLEDAFLLGCTDGEACFAADITQQTLYNYQKENPDFLVRKNMLKENPVFVARKSLIDAMNKDGKLALSFLERKKKDEFSLKTEIAHSGEVEQKHKLDVTKLTDDQLKALRDAMVNGDDE